ncbi:monocarboxylate transporter 3-like [Argopecten irradians]|uniref:monocarboxylate transporter 3-like n=1 Tax=Argopecten irradians TaxID=31199 RepID=UPI003710193A
MTVVSNDQITKAPDGGWGWIVVMASFMQHALIDGMTCTFGIFYDDILATFNEGSARTQVLSSIIVGVSFLIGPFTGVLINRFDCRSVAMVGGAVGFMGTLLSTFSKNLNIMILLYGVVGGIGLGLVYSPSLVIVSYYLDKRRALATGIATCGSGVGCLVFSPVNQVLIDTYRWKGALWIVSAILFNCTLFAVVYRPLKFTNRKNNPVEPIAMSSNANTSFDLKKTVDELKQSLKTITVPFFTDSAFLLFMTSSVLVAMGIQIPYNLLPTFALAKGLSDSDGALLISILGMSNTVSMVLSGLVADYPWADSILTYSVPLLIGGVASVFVSCYSDFITLAIYCIVIGVGIGTYGDLRLQTYEFILGYYNYAGVYYAGAPV